MTPSRGLTVPANIGEICRPDRAALIVYDMQNGIVAQMKNGKEIVAGSARLLAAARLGGFRTFYTRHIFLPNRYAGVGQLRRAMAWQHKENPNDTKPIFETGSVPYQIVSELAPESDDVVIDKITMSAFEGTFLDLAMRDAQLQAFIIFGIALEVGIEPTVRHALDLNYIPIIVPDLCGSRTPEGHRRSLETLRDTWEVIEASEAELLPLLSKTSVPSNQAKGPAN